MTDIADRLRDLSAALGFTDQHDDARLVREAAAEIQSLRRRLAVHEERLPRPADHAAAEAGKIIGPSRTYGFPSPDWP